MVVELTSRACATSLLRIRLQGLRLRRAAHRFVQPILGPVELGNCREVIRPRLGQRLLCLDILALA
jgi:hypothetical protein